jgi:cytochrome c-type biogenesis protein CcmH/NrfG
VGAEAPPLPGPPDRTVPPVVPAPVVPTEEFNRYLQQGKEAFSGRRYSAAAEYYRVALKHHPGSLEAKDGLGFSLVLGKTDRASNEEAVKLLKEVVEKDRFNARAWFGLGMAHQATREEDEAVEAYRQYLFLEPGGRFSTDARIALKQLGEN